MKPAGPDTQPSSVVRSPIDETLPHPARRYDYWLGGKDHFAVDRVSADAIADVFPTIRTAAVENRYFLQRVVGWLAGDAGIRQFLDIGAGLPTTPAVHDVAQAITPEARIVGVDNDRMVVCHGRARVNATPQGAVAYIDGDLRRPDAILADPTLRATLDLTQPVAVLLVAVLHFLLDTDHPHQAVASLVEALPSGSYLALSHATLDPLPGYITAPLSALTQPQAGHGPFRPRTRDEIAAFVTGLDPVDPGLVSIVDWCPGRSPIPRASRVEAAVYGVVARVP